MELLPEGTLRRSIFEWCDRCLGELFFGNGNPCLFCKRTNPIVSAVIEQDHYIKNAGKA